MAQRYIMVGKNKRIFLQLACLFLGLLFFVFAFEGIAYLAKIEKHNENARVFSNCEIILTDEYDSATSSFRDFLDSKESFDILKNTLEAVKKNKELTFYEFSQQNLEICGNFHGDEHFCVNDDYKFLNQNTGEDVLSAVKTIQCDYQFYKDYSLQEKINGNIDFDKKYFTDDLIPIVMGCEYEKLYKKGDVLTCLFLGKKIKVSVAGFFRENSIISTKDEIDTAYYIFMPMPAVDLTKNSRDNRILLSVKTDGMIRVSTYKNYKKQISILDEICKETDFKYSLPLMPIKASSFFALNKAEFVLILIVALVLLLYALTSLRKQDIIIRFKNNNILKMTAVFFIVNAAIFSLIHGLLYIILSEYRHIVVSSISQFIFIYVLFLVLSIYICMNNSVGEKAENE